MPLLASYCYDISDAKDISAVYHGVAVKRRCVRCTVTGIERISSEIAGERSETES